jgi:uncharacterized protein YecE (DUF72 family)
VLEASTEEVPHWDYLYSAREVVPGPSPPAGKHFGRSAPFRGVSRYWLGCSGWAYDDWVGPFYPRGTPPAEFLERYARVFRTVEVDSSFYRPPTPFLLRRWADRTPDGFRFALKVPRDVTHAKEAGGEEVLAHFLESLAPLRNRGKLGPIVLQFPPSFRADRGTPLLLRLLDTIPKEFLLAVELRHKSWWTEATRRALEAREAVLVWSVLPDARPPPWVTGPFLYARFIGDRALEKFDHIQRDGRAGIVEMRARFEEEGRPAELIFAFSNNHYMGFGPGTTAVVAEVLGEPTPDLGAAGRTVGQSTLDVGP